MRLLLVLLLIAFAVTASADGGYFKAVDMKETKPTIPYQRAIVRYQDGVETLVVESVLNGEAGDYAWIIPVPSKPTKIGAATKGTLRSALRVMSPKIAVPGDPFQAWVVAVVAAIYLFSLRGRLKRYERLSHAIIYEVGIHVLVFVSCAIFYPVFAGGGQGPVQASEVKTVGSYEVAQVHGEDGAAVTKWLSSSGFEVAPPAIKVIQDYAREGWHFVAAKLKKGKDNVAHPLWIEFDATEPVYPMRLTRLMGEPLRLDLIVIGTMEAAVPHMKVWSCSNGPPKPYHPELEKLDIMGGMWTYLRGELSDAQMASDFRIKWTDPRHRQVSIATVSTAGTFALIAAGAAFYLLVGTLMFLERFSAVNFGKGFLAVVVLTAVVGVWRFYSFAHIDAIERMPRRLVSQNKAVLRSKLRKEALAKPFETAFLKRIREVSTDPEWLALNSDVPYGYELRKTAGGYEYVEYDAYARPKFYPIGDDGGIARDPR